MKDVIEMVVKILLIIGALNWGIIGLFGINFVSKLFKKYPRVEKLIYVLVGIAGLYTLL